MTTHIGAVEIPSITEVSPSTDQVEEEIHPIGYEEPLVFEQGPELEELEISIMLHSQLHSSGKPAEKQKKDIQKLLEQDPEDNDFDYLEWKGYLAVESVDLPTTSDQMGLIEGNITATYFPWPEYEQGSAFANAISASGVGSSDGDGLLVITYSVRGSGTGSSAGSGSLTVTTS